MKAFCKSFLCKEPGCGTRIVIKGTVDEKGTFCAEMVSTIEDIDWKLDQTNGRWKSPWIKVTDMQYGFDAFDEEIKCAKSGGRNEKTGEICYSHACTTLNDLRRLIGRG